MKSPIQSLLHNTSYLQQLSLGQARRDKYGSLGLEMEEIQIRAVAADSLGQLVVQKRRAPLYFAVGPVCLQQLRRVSRAKRVAELLLFVSWLHRA